MNIIAVGSAAEVLVGGGLEAEEVHKFIRLSHQTAATDGTSYVGIGVLKDGTVWLLASMDRDEIEARLRAHDAVAAEILELNTLQ